MVNIPKIFKYNEADSAGLRLPLLPLRDIVVFPYMVVPLFVGRDKSIAALTVAMNGNKNIFLSTQRVVSVDSPTAKDINKVGVVGTILQLLRLPDGTVKVLVEGKTRARTKKFLKKTDFFEVEVELLDVIDETTTEIFTLERNVVESFAQYSKLNKSIPKDLVNRVTAITSPSKLADTIASHFSFKISDKQKLLEYVDLEKRLLLLLDLIKIECEVYKMDQRVKGRVKKQMEKTQKNYYLNEQMRAIKKEMGTGDDSANELKELQKRIKRKRLSKEAASKVRQEFKKLKMMTPMSAEATVVRNYIDWILSLPWFERSKVQTDIDKAETILNDDHYGLKKPKERILEYLAVQCLIKKVRGPILCLVGPPGVGKTSLAKSVARATGRKFIRLSLGGVRDEAEIRGHRRTYIGAMPGKIVQSLKKAGANNPVFCLDEVDKMSMDFRGDPSSALLEVLDPEQNYNFNDHYLDLGYDLSDIFFITTANTLPEIPLPLQDRMEIIRLSGYTEYEKYHIAKDFLLTKQLEMNGLKDYDISFAKNAISTIIQSYTREAGVRNLEREIASICRKIARDVVKNKENKKYNITSRTVQKHLGPPRFRHDQMETQNQIGLVTGLAWTQVGGELLYIETLTMPGKGKLIVTGKLGDVMKESAQAALSFVRSRGDYLKIKKELFEELDIHIHVPEGAIPKDGPSAGISMCASIVSALTKKAVRRDLAMTGEITLRGRVLPIGGLKEKLLAAHRGGLKTILVPVENEKDLKDLPAIISKELEIILVEHMDEVLSHALILNEGECLFQKSDLPIGIAPIENDQRISLN